MLQGVVEDVVGGAPAECPGGRFIVDAANGIGGGVATRTFPNGKDQIYIVHTERDECVDEAGQLIGFDRGIVVGGTGKYAGVQGTWERNYSGLIQYVDYAAQPLQYFGSVTGSSIWEIVFPD